MQTTMIRIDFPVELVERVRETHPQDPSFIEVMHHEDIGEFSPLEEEVVWYPKYECLAFAMSFSESDMTLRLNDFSVGCLDAEFDVQLPANSTIEKHNQCMSRFYEGVPYEENHESEEDILRDRVYELISDLNAIDPGCADNNTFCGEFVWDITFVMW